MQCWSRIQGSVLAGLELSQQLRHLPTVDLSFCITVSCRCQASLANDVQCVFTLIGHLCIFGRMSGQVLGPFLSLFIELYELLVNSRCKSFIIFSPFCSIL